MSVGSHYRKHLKRAVAKDTFLAKSLKKLAKKDDSHHLAGSDMEVAGHLVEGERPVHPASVLVTLRLQLSRWHLRVQS